LPVDPQVVGTVVNDSGQPQEGVPVWLSAGAKGDGTVPALGRTTTDAQGRFRLAIPPLPPVRSSYEPLAVWAHAPGMVPARHSVPWVTFVDRDEVALTLTAPMERAITLIGPDGKPAAGADVVPSSFYATEKGYFGTLLTCPDELAKRLRTAATPTGYV